MSTILFYITSMVSSLFVPHFAGEEYLTKNIKGFYGSFL